MKFKTTILSSEGLVGNSVKFLHFPLYGISVCFYTMSNLCLMYTVSACDLSTHISVPLTKYLPMDCSEDSQVFTYTKVCGYVRLGAIVCYPC